MPFDPLGDDYLWRVRHPGPLHSWERTLARYLFALATLTSVLILYGWTVVCTNYEGSEACLGRPTEFAWHVGLGLGALIPAGLMLHFALRGPRWAWVASLVFALAMYGVSILFGDAGTHGWDNLKLFP